MSKIEIMDQRNAREIIKAINSALLLVKNSYDIEITLSDLKITGQKAVVGKIRAEVKSSAEDQKKAEKVRWDMFCGRVGLEHSHYGKDFMMNGTIYRLIEVNPSAHRYPVIAERIKDGKHFKFTARHVIAQFSKTTA